MIVDLFAGPGGWSEGLRALGYTGPRIGLEIDAAACATARAAGHDTVQADVARLDPRAVAARWPDAQRDPGRRLEGLVASPPCRTYSVAGGRAARLLDPILMRCIADLAGGRDTRRELRAQAHELLLPIALAAEREAAARQGREPDVENASTRARRDADLSLLVVEPLRWALALEPTWIVLEQVPPALDLWRALARRLRAEGYSVWTAILSAERYGVPQTRKRTILMAHRHRVVAPPVPTHQPFVSGEPAAHEYTLEGEVLPWVSMAEAFAREPGFAGDQSIARWRWRNGNQANTAVRRADQPAPTIHFGPRLNEVTWIRDGRPMHVTVEQAAILQSFPRAYPWQGPSTKQFEQVGNAMPPLLARAVLGQLVETTPAKRPVPT